jgi:hypothetical protein
MEKETGSIRFIETDDGYRVEVKGKDLKDAMNCGCGCMPMFGGAMAQKIVCCAPAEGSTAAECCPPEEKKK